MIGSCMKCAKASDSGVPGMVLCDARGGLVNSTYARSYHDCFVPRRAAAAALIDDFQADGRDI